MGALAQHNSERAGGSGEARNPEPRYLSVGRVLRPHGVRGELRVEISTDYPDRLVRHIHFFLAHPHSPAAVRRYAVEGLRFHKEALLLKLEGCDDRDGAEQLRQEDVAAWAKEMLHLNREYGVRILGGCCGTTDAHISALTRSGPGSQPERLRPSP